MVTEALAPAAPSSVIDLPSIEILAMRRVLPRPETWMSWPTAKPSSMNEPRSAPAPRVTVLPLATTFPLNICVARVPPIAWSDSAPPNVTSVWPSVMIEMSTFAVGAFVRRIVYESPVPGAPHVEPHWTRVRPPDSSRNTPGVSSSIDCASMRLTIGSAGVE